MSFTTAEIAPLASIEEWEDDVLVRYPDPEAIANANTKKN